jgi:hypothetical protein
MVDTGRGYHLLDFLNTRERIVGDRIKKHRIKRKNIFQNFGRRQHPFFFVFMAKKKRKTKSPKKIKIPTLAVLT